MWGYRERHSGIRRLAIGLSAGFIGTAVMTAAMEVFFRRLPAHEQAPLPPRQLTMAMADRVNLTPRLHEPERLSLTLAAHFAYGSMVGALYVPAASGLRVPVPLKGSLFGLGVWGVSYMGWIPALRLLPSATEWSPRRNALMIVAHFIWGTTIAWQTDRRLPGHD